LYCLSFFDLRLLITPLTDSLNLKMGVRRCLS
jgi:hypothetical protein